MHSRTLSLGTSDASPYDMRYNSDYQAYKEEEPIAVEEGEDESYEDNWPDNQ